MEDGSIISESSLQIAIGYSPDSTMYVTEVWKLRERVPTLRTGVYMHKTIECA